MTLTQTELIALLTQAGVYRPTWRLLDATYETVDAGWLTRQAWPAWVRSLPPHLTEAVDVGGGLTVRRPRWIAEVFDCDDHTFSLMEFVIRCRADDCAKTNTPRAGTGLGSLSYMAVPKAGNRRDGGHDINWFVDENGQFRIFEGSENLLVDFLSQETLSVWEGEAR